jgi:hypothetical protein
MSHNFIIGRCSGTNLGNSSRCCIIGDNIPGQPDTDDQFIVSNIAPVCEDWVIAVGVIGNHELVMRHLNETYKGVFIEEKIETMKTKYLAFLQTCKQFVRDNMDSKTIGIGNGGKDVTHQ